MNFNIHFDLGATHKCKINNKNLTKTTCNRKPQKIHMFPDFMYKLVGRVETNVDEKGLHNAPLYHFCFLTDT